MKDSDALSRAVAVLGTLTFLLFSFRSLNLPIAPFFLFACAAAFLVLLASRPSLRELLLAPVIAPALALAYTKTGGAFAAGQYSVFKDALGFLGLASLILLAFRALRHNEALREYLIALGIPFAAILTCFALCLVALHQPNVYDLFLYRLDRAFGIEVSASVARWFAAVPLLHDTCWLAYQALPLFIGLLITACLRTGVSPLPLFKVFIAAGIAGSLLYLILPAAGPVYAFRSDFPNHLPSQIELSTTTTTNPVPRNCMPSLHFAWAILMLWNVPRKPRFLRAALLPFVVFTALATLGLGEHYFVDLVVACPFAACVQAACIERWRAAAVTAAVTLLWIIYLRFGLSAIPPQFAVLWTAAIASVAIGWWVGAQPVMHLPGPLGVTKEPVYINA